MEKGTQINNKYRTRPVSDEQDTEIKALQARMQTEREDNVVFMEAKHLYFEALDNQEKQKTAKPDKKERQTMTVEKTKLGVTLVISKENCAKLGFKGTSTTKEVIKHIKSKLGLVV